MRHKLRLSNHNFLISHNFFVILIILTGVLIRLFHYLHNPALWLDEATLSLNIIKKSYGELLLPLDDLQVAPIGFLLIEKFFVDLFGNSEYSLRLLPFLAGIASVPLFYLFAEKYVTRKVAIIALLFFIFGRSLVYYSIEVKQYSLDVFVFIASFLFFQAKDKFDLSIPKSALMGIIGAIFIWISHISVIVLTAVGIWNLVMIGKARDWKKMLPFLIMSGLWFFSFALNYYFFLGDHSHQSLQETAFDTFNFFPTGTFDISGLNWYINLFISLFEYPLGLKFSLVAIALSLIGIIILIRTKEFIILFLFVPLLIHLILAILRIYPCKDRLVLYNGAAIIILMSYSIYHALHKIPYGKYLIAATVLLLLIKPVALSVRGFDKENIRPAMELIGKNYKPGDLIYVQYGSRWSFEYYKERYIPDDAEIIKGRFIRSNPEYFDLSFNKFTGRDRVWLLFSHYTDDEKEIVISKCDKYGKLLNKFELARSGAYLYNFDNHSLEISGKEDLN